MNFIVYTEKSAKSMPRHCTHLIRSKRRGEYTCRCGAYPFPHRMFGGHCTGFNFVRQYWEALYGSGNCATCINYVDGDCEVVSGKEDVKYCEALMEFCNFEEIKTPWKR
jgi:hypothetical protein